MDYLIYIGIICLLLCLKAFNWEILIYSCVPKYYNIPTRVQRRYVQSHIFRFICFQLRQRYYNGSFNRSLRQMTTSVLISLKHNKQVYTHNMSQVYLYTLYKLIILIHNLIYFLNPSSFILLLTILHINLFYL